MTTQQQNIKPESVSALDSPGSLAYTIFLFLGHLSQSRPIELTVRPERSGGSAYGVFAHGIAGSRLYMHFGIRAVFVLLALLAVVMRVIMIAFPQRAGKADAAVLAAVASVATGVYPGTKITKVEEIK